MPQYTVPVQGGSITVNASDPAAAVQNAQQQSGSPVTGGATQVAASPNALTSSIDYTAPSVQGNQPNPNQGAGLDALLQALQAGDLRAFEEMVRQFNQTFGLSVAGLTGTYNGQPTLPALTSYATQFGQWGVPTTGQSTLAAQQQAYAQQLGAIQAASQLQADPFRQQQVIGQLGRLLGGQGVAGFQAPNIVPGVGTAGGNTQGGMGYLQQLIGQITGQPTVPAAQPLAQPGATPVPSGTQTMGTVQQIVDDIHNPASNQTPMNQVLNAIPTPNQLNSVEFLRSAPSTQSMVLQGMREKYGLDPNDSLRQIQNTLPQFRAPSTMGGFRR